MRPYVVDDTWGVGVVYRQDDPVATEALDPTDFHRMGEHPLDDWGESSHLIPRNRVIRR